MRTKMGVSELRRRCFGVIDEVRESGQEVVVTKRGRPVVRIVPARGAEPEVDLEGAIAHEDPDIFSTGEEWQADGGPSGPCDMK